MIIELKILFYQWRMKHYMAELAGLECAVDNGVYECERVLDDRKYFKGKIQKYTNKIVNLEE